MEQLSLRVTAAAAEALEDTQVRSLLELHYEETKEHLHLIAERLEAHGDGHPPSHDVGAESPEGDSPLRLTTAAYIHAHGELAAYELLWSLAERAGDDETARVARRILNDEQRAAVTLSAVWEYAVELVTE